MTVGQLISLLEEHPADLRVVVDGYEHGYDDLAPEQVRVVNISVDTGKYEWEGRHGRSLAPDDAVAAAHLIAALALCRASFRG